MTINKINDLRRFLHVFSRFIFSARPSAPYSTRALKARALCHKVRRRALQSRR